MNPTKKKPAKRKNNPIVEKLLKLKYRINDVYRLIKEGNGKPKFDLTLLGDTRIDKDWVMKLIDSARKNNYVSAEDMKQCNSIWRKYEG